MIGKVGSRKVSADLGKRGMGNAGKGKVGVGEHEEIGGVVGGVGADDELVDGERRGRSDGGEPLDGERRPFESVGDDEIVDERGVFLPNPEVF